MPRALPRPAGAIWLLALILALALLLRLWQIDRVPPGFHFDEAFEGLEAWRILTQPGYRPVFLEGNFGVPPLNAYANAVTFAATGLFGVAPGPVPMRVTAALFGVAGVLAVYLLAAELRTHDRMARLSPAFPLFAAATLAVMRWHIHFSRMGIEPVIVPLEWALCTWLLLHGWRTRSLITFAALGLVLAACLYTYQAAWLIPPATAATALGLMLGERSARATGRSSSIPWGGLLLAALAALLVAAPLLLFFARDPAWVWLRPSQISVAGATSGPAEQSVWYSTWATLRMYWPFGVTGDIDPRRNIPGEPALPVWLALPLMVGVVVALRRIRETPFWVTLLGLASMLVVGAVSEYAPHFHRILGASAPTALLIAIALDALWRWRPSAAPWLRWSAVALLTLAGFAGARDYFVRWAALPDLYYAFDEGLWQAGNWIAAQPPEVPIYLTPRTADHPTLAFAWETQPGSHGPPTTFDGRLVFPMADPAGAQPADYVVIDDEDFRTPLLLPQALPAATIKTTFNDFAGERYATVYQQPATGETARRPQVTLNSPLGDGITLLGYDLLPEQPHAGETLYLQLHWGVDRKPTRDWTVFTHLVDPARRDAAPVAGKDSRPGGGSLPTTRWQPGWRVLDEYQIALPADLPAGDYALASGLYADDGAHLPDAPGGIDLGTIRIDAAP